jgi:hypothetical protein
MKKITFIFFFILSFSVQAKYQCSFKLYSIDDLKEVIARSVMSVDVNQMKTQNIQEFFIEDKKGKKITSIHLRAFLSGEPGQEEMVGNVFRRHSRGKNHRLTLISERVEVKQAREESLWFDFYKLDVTCSLDQSPGYLHKSHL